MSQHSSSFPPNLLKTLEADIYKFKLFGPPVFRLNVQCKHKEHCKYGKYSCQYSHESFCKFQRNGRKCQNNSCTHQHELPLEYQLARAFFTKEMQFTSDRSSFEAQESTSESHFSSNLTSNSGTSENAVFRFKVNDSTTKSHEPNPKNNVPNPTQPPKQAEAHFSAFSPAFQKPANSATIATDQKRSITYLNPTQNAFKRDRNSPTINHFLPFNAHQETKSSESNKKAADHKSPLPLRISASKQAPPPTKSTSKNPIPTSNQTNNHSQCLSSSGSSNLLR